LLNKALSLCLSLLICFTSLATRSSASKESLSLSAQSAILIEADTQTVLFEKKAHLQLGMASTTKIMTAIITLEHTLPTDVVTVSPIALNTEGSSVYLTRAERLSVEDLLYALLLESANDAAVALAIHVAGSISEFSLLMNQKAEELGLKNTNFTNPHGLYDEDHYTTAYDLAIIMSYAMKDPLFAKISATKKYVSTSVDKGLKRYFTNHNRLLSMYNGVCGGKTGFTKATGRTLVSCAEKNGLRVIAVTLNAPNDWRDHINMFEYAFSNYESVPLAQKHQFRYKVHVVNSPVCEIVCSNKNSYSFFKETGNSAITYELFLRSFYYAPINKGDILGYVIFYENGSVIAKAEILAESDAPLLEQKSVWQKIADFFKRILKFSVN